MTIIFTPQTYSNANDLNATLRKLDALGEKGHEHLKIVSEEKNSSCILNTTSKPVHLLARIWRWFFGTTAEENFSHVTNFVCAFFKSNERIFDEPAVCTEANLHVLYCLKGRLRKSKAVQDTLDPLIRKIIDQKHFEHLRRDTDRIHQEAGVVTEGHKHRAESPQPKKKVDLEKEDLSEFIQEAKTLMADTQAAHAQLLKENKETERAQSLDQQVEKLQRQVSGLNLNIKEKETEIGKLKEKQAQLLKEKEGLEKENKESKERAQSLDHQMLELGRQVTGLGLKLKEKEAEIDVLNEAQAQLRLREKEALEKGDKETRERVKAHEQEILGMKQRAEAASDDLKAEQARLLKENSDLKRQIQEFLEQDRKMKSKSSQEAAPLKAAEPTLQRDSNLYRPTASIATAPSITSEIVVDKSPSPSTSAKSKEGLGSGLENPPIEVKEQKKPPHKPSEESAAPPLPVAEKAIPSKTPTPSEARLATPAPISRSVTKKPTLEEQFFTALHGLDLSNSREIGKQIIALTTSLKSLRTQDKLTPASADILQSAIESLKPESRAFKPSLMEGTLYQYLSEQSSSFRKRIGDAGDYEKNPSDQGKSAFLKSLRKNFASLDALASSVFVERKKEFEKARSSRFQTIVKDGDLFEAKFLAVLKQLDAWEEELSGTFKTLMTAKSIESSSSEHKVLYEEFIKNQIILHISRFNLDDLSTFDAIKLQKKHDELVPQMQQLFERWYSTQSKA